MPVSKSSNEHAKMSGMKRCGQHGQVNLTAVFLLLGVIIAAVWIWKRLSPDTQDYLVEQAIPVTLAVAATVAAVWAGVLAVQRRRRRLAKRARLLARLPRETVPDKRRDLAFALIEVNRYRVDGLESVAPMLVDILSDTLRTAVGDKQHRIRGMAASYLGVLQDRRVIPLLMKALDDDHAYVRGCAALGLGRLRAIEAKDKLLALMKEDWDQTVRSRAREAVERLS